LLTPLTDKLKTTLHVDHDSEDYKEIVELFNTILFLLVPFSNFTRLCKFQIILHSSFTNEVPEGLDCKDLIGFSLPVLNVLVQVMRYLSENTEYRASWQARKLMKEAGV